jgi:hypothetical protein
MAPELTTVASPVSVTMPLIPPEMVAPVPLLAVTLPTLMPLLVPVTDAPVKTLTVTPVSVPLP